jgi:hypothetical protein
MNKKVNVADNKYEFKETKICFFGEPYKDVFMNKNNKTLQETIEHSRYKCLKNEVLNKYSAHLNERLGVFLKYLKNNNNVFYRRFLNKYGDCEYSKFKIISDEISKNKGIYLYCTNDYIKYVGQTKNSFKKRINNGHGRISPKNVFLDGQSTNCHLNSVITKSKDDISLFVLTLEDENLIDSLEKKLIEQYSPDWNNQFKRKDSN